MTHPIQKIRVIAVELQEESIRTDSRQGIITRIISLCDEYYKLTNKEDPCSEREPTISVSIPYNKSPSEVIAHLRSEQTQILSLGHVNKWLMINRTVDSIRDLEEIPKYGITIIADATSVRLQPALESEQIIAYKYVCNISRPAPRPCPPISDTLPRTAYCNAQSDKAIEEDREYVMGRLMRDHHIDSANFVEVSTSALKDQLIHRDAELIAKLWDDIKQRSDMVVELIREQDEKAPGKVVS